MVRQYKDNDKGQQELQAQASDNGAVRAKREWDVYMFKEKEKGAPKADGDILGSFQIRGGKAKDTGNPYIFLSGFDKKIGGMNIPLTKKVDKLIECLVDAGFDSNMCEVLEKRGILK